MIENDLKEKNFESAIEQWLVNEGGYVKGNQATYDKERAIDLPTLIRFIDQTQHKKWELFCRKHGANAESRLYNDFQDATGVPVPFECKFACKVKKSITDSNKYGCQFS